MTTFTTFNVNDIIFVEGVGYGTLLECGHLKSIAIKEPPSLIEKRQSIYFDPELFNSDSDILTRQKSETAVLVMNPKIEAKESVANSEKFSPTDTKQEGFKDKEKTSDFRHQNKLNIVKVRLEGTNALVYTLDSNMRKYVIVPVKPMFLPAMGTLNIKIQIGKTIESFKKQILELLGLKHSHYFNIKLFTTSPFLIELNCPGKTVWQYGIRENSILTMTAEHGFCFQNVPSEFTEYFNVTNNGLTFVSLPKKPKISSNTVIALPPIPNQKAVIVPSNIEETKLESVEKNEKNEELVSKQKEITQVREVKKVEENKIGQDGSEKREEKSNEQKQKGQGERGRECEPPQTLRISGDKLLRSGKQYFQVRLDKLPQNSLHLKMGVSEQNEARRWLFSPLTMQKIYEEGNQTKSVQPYGMTFKQNDLIGVLAKIDKHKNLMVTFFKNSVNLGCCFKVKVQEVTFVFEIGSEGQISLDSRIQPPLDSYRFR